MRTFQDIRRGTFSLPPTTQTLASPVPWRRPQTPPTGDQYLYQDLLFLVAPANGAICTHKAVILRRRRRNVLGKAETGGGMFLNRLSKLGRCSSNSEKEVPDAEYKLKVVDLPLVEQTITKIPRRIEDSKDKTEYWMPVPWRCIDYLAVDEHKAHNKPDLGNHDITVILEGAATSHDCRGLETTSRHV